MAQVISGTQEELDLSSDKLARRLSFRFRLPVPSLVEDQYANVEHEGESIGQYTIENENGYKFITISTWHLSEFKLTFTNEKEKYLWRQFWFLLWPRPVVSGGQGSE